MVTSRLPGMGPIQSRGFLRILHHRQETHSNYELMLRLLGVEDEARSDNLVLMLILMLMLSCLEKGGQLVVWIC